MNINKRKLKLILIDALVIVGVYFGIQFLSTFKIQSAQVHGAFTLLKLVTILLTILITRYVFRIYSIVWRYSDVMNYIRLVIADTVAGVIYLVLGRINSDLNIGIAYSLIIITTILIATLIIRFLYQIEYAHHNKVIETSTSDEDKMHKINVAIVGAGNVGANLAAELLRNPKSHYHPYCFIDIDSNKYGNTLNGLKIYKEDENIVDTLKSLPIQEIVIAIPDADGETKSKLYNLYKQTDCKVKVYDYLVMDDSEKDGKLTLREFKIEDLLFRDSLNINSKEAKAYYKDKVVMVTGGGGSIGSELSRQIAKLEPKQLIIVDIYENNAYEIQQELIRRYGDKLNLKTIIASVRDVKRLDEIFRTYKPNIVFHAAAHKHVPLMEVSCCEAIKNNVFGTYNVANMAEKYGVEKFLLISTDKAVNPTNVMGASKRLCEMVIQCRKDSKTEFTAVRFGNVLGSNGSVIPLFKKQIAAGGPITLTDKRIVRYFMTIPEAVALVMETGAMAKNGELFVLDMGKPVKILELAENMITLSGLKPYEDIDIVEIGLRPGEKLYEELLMKSEDLDKTNNDLIFIERDKGLAREEVEAKLEILSAAVEKEGNEAIVEAVRQTVPTYHDPEEVNREAAKAKEMQEANNR